MTSERWQQIEEILDEVMLRPSGERTAQLDRLCGEDATLRRDVEEMLGYCEQAKDEGFLEDSPLSDDHKWVFDSILKEARDEDLDAGARVGSYQIVWQVGRGGMGEVYLAERADGQFQKDVALKVVKRGMDTHEILQRFRYEREILARLEHPNIAQLYDGGVTDDGRPYFAMEYVKGEPLDVYCDRNQLSVRARLELFKTVCEAVRYAHRNLVVHRDLKPGNILVSEDEAGQPQVKLLDFGIAKLLEEDATLYTIPVTEVGTRRMTPSYAAPEQVIGGPTTTATDVYALGVILYKLLTGRRPYHFEERSATSIEQVIRYTMPDRPSAVVVRPVHSNGAAEPTPETLSRQRAASPRMLHRQLKGDLDAMILMALRKEPERRYASAGEFLDDIQRYLDDRPVVAQHDSVGYRASKFVQRHTAGVAAATFAFLALLVGLITASWQANVARSQAHRAEQETARAIAIQDMLVGMISMRNPEEMFLDMDEVPSDTFTVGDLIRHGIATLPLLKDPRSRADMLDVLGEVSISYNDFNQAVVLYSQALEIKQRQLGKMHPEVAASLHGLALALINQSQHEQADSLLRQVLGIQRATLADPHLDLLSTLNDLAYVQMWQGKAAEADTLYREALAMAGRLEAVSPDTLKVEVYKAESLSGLARARFEQQALDDARQLFLQALEIQQKWLREGHPKIANTMYGLAGCLKALGDVAGAREYFEKALTIYRQEYGDQHVMIANIFFSLGGLYNKAGEYEQAEAHYLKALEVYESTVGAEHLWKSSPLIYLGRLRLERGDAAGAVPVLREGLALCEAHGLPEDNTLIHKARLGLGAALTMLQRFGEAEAILQVHYEAIKDLPDKQDLQQQAIKRLVDLYEAWPRPDEAATYRKLLEGLDPSV